MGVEYHEYIERGERNRREAFAVMEVEEKYADLLVEVSETWVGKNGFKVIISKIGWPGDPYTISDSTGGEPQQKRVAPGHILISKRYPLPKGNRENTQLAAFNEEVRKLQKERGINLPQGATSDEVVTALINSGVI